MIFHLFSIRLNVFKQGLAFADGSADDGHGAGDGRARGGAADGFRLRAAARRCSGRARREAGEAVLERSMVQKPSGESANNSEEA